MRVLVALENRFLKTQNGNIYSTTVCDYGFWRRYLQVFDEVLVLARVEEIQEIEFDKAPANGPNVSFFSLPYFIGPWGYLKQYRRLKSLVKQSIAAADVFILRIPGTIASTLWHYLKTKRIPYGVEVVGDPWESITQASVKSIVSPVARYILTKHQKKQCRNAVAAAYTSKSYLQRKYPPGGWSTHYSSIELPDDVIIDESRLAKRFESMNDPLNGKRPFRICHIGSMSALYKAQDKLMEAVAICRREGFNVELTFLGDGKYKDVFLAEAEQLEISDFVNFAGHVPPYQVAEYLDAADIFILMSLTEGLPRALIEAMARGLPCIGTNVGGIKELLTDEDMVEPKSAEKLAEKIMTVISDLDRLVQMAKRNIDKAREYSSGELNKRRVEFYKKVAEATKTYHAG